MKPTSKSCLIFCPGDPVQFFIASSTNCYIIQANRAYLLVDTGYQKDYSDFLKELDVEEIGINEINYLLLRHHHDDHSGFTNDLLSISQEFYSTPLSSQLRGIETTLHLQAKTSFLTVIYAYDKILKYGLSFPECYLSPSRRPGCGTVE
ncbi:MAG: MBL fold metallo-hydrolase [bacterium]